VAVRPTTSSGAQALAGFALDLSWDAIPPSALDAAKRHVLDALGCGLAAHALGEGGAARAVALADGGRAEASLIGARERVPAAAAALANGMLVHALDFDDTHPQSVTHISAVVVPAALAAAEARGADGRKLLTAIVAGSEVVARIGMAASGAFHARGFHPTAVAGVFGAAAAAAALGGLDRATATSALGIAGSMASGLFAYLDAGTQTKPIHAGWAAHAGLRAVALAAAGAEGPDNVLEGRFGLYEAFVGEVPEDLSAQLADLGSRWETPRTAFKLYPACHYMHGVLTAAADLPPVDAREIDEIRVAVPAGPAVDLVLEPRELKVAPRTPYEAKFSLQYSLGTLLVHGRVDVRSYLPEALAEPAVLALARRVSHELRDFDTYPAAFPGALAVTLHDGRVLSADAPYQAGAPERPLADAALRAKFRANASLALDAAAVAALEESLLALDAADDVAAAIAPLRGA
jgi:2-methylcitrate dehydratase PrpD